MRGETHPMTASRSLLAAPPLLRQLRADEAPYPGALRAGDPPAVWVPIEELPPVIWSAHPDEHVLVPCDIARTPSGHDALLPHCPERLVTALDHESLPPGATVTVAISILRGASEARRCGITRGGWWLDAAGRPVLAAAPPATGGADWVDEAARVLTHLADGAGPTMGPMLVELRDLLANAAPSPRRVGRLEEALFSAAEPEPLCAAKSSLPPRERTPEPRRAASLRREVGEVGELVSEPMEPTWATPFVDREIVARGHEAFGVVAASVLGFADAVRSIARRRSTDRGRHVGTPRARRPSRPPRSRPDRRRRAPVLVAVAVAAAILVIGLAWPDDDSAADRATAVSQPSSTPTSRVDDAAALADPAASTAASAPVATETAESVEALLTRLSTCPGTPEGCADVLEDSSTPPPTGAVAAPAGTRRVELVDEYGGVSVYRVTASGQTTQILVLVSTNGKWLIRDVYDVADQP